MDERDIRELLASASGQVRPDAARPIRALYAGRQRRRRLLVTRAGSMLTVVAIAASAAAYVAAQPKPAEPLAAIDCGRPMTTGTIRVATTDSGLLLRVRNASNSVAELKVAKQGAAIPPGEDNLQLAVPPGRHQITCTTESGAHTVATIDVVDDRDLWSHGAVLGCAYPRVYDMTDRFLLGDGEPVALTRRWLGAGPHDEVIRVGYSQTSQRLVAVVRDGRSVALATWHELLPGTWTLGVVRICSQSVRPPTPTGAAA
ncbi:MAG: hypothetical protein QOE05_3214 [Actinomycetota bacterium]|jgi:hypothetical protein|nr:hypothetical protein [Actinomycetota bacterium]